MTQSGLLAGQAVLAGAVADARVDDDAIADLDVVGEPLSRRPRRRRRARRRPASRAASIVTPGSPPTTNRSRWLSAAGPDADAHSRRRASSGFGRSVRYSS